MLSKSLIILTLFRNDTTPVLALILNHNHTIINSQIENTQEEDKILWYNCTSYSYSEVVDNIRYINFSNLTFHVLLLKLRQWSSSPSGVEEIRKYTTEPSNHKLNSTILLNLSRDNKNTHLFLFKLMNRALSEVRWTWKVEILRSNFTNLCHSIQCTPKRWLGHTLLQLLL